MVTLRQCFDQLKKALAPVAGETARQEALFLLEGIGGYKKEELYLHPDSPMGEEQREKLDQAVKRRLGGEPIQYILGRWEFYGYEFIVGPQALIPRADTETLVEEGLRAIEGAQGPTVIDLCAGSGCIAIAISKERPDAKVIGVERSKEALALFLENIALNQSNAKALEGDVLSQDCYRGLPKAQLILSNPPYITLEEMEALSPEVKREPGMALYGGVDGLTFYRALCKNCKEALLPGGTLAMEFGMGQGPSICTLLEGEGYEGIHLVKDLAGIDRVAVAILPCCF